MSGKGCFLVKEKEFPVTTMEFFQTMDRVRRGWLQFMPQQSLKKSYFGILMFIRHNCAKNPDQKGAKISDLAHQMRQTMPSISQKINALEQEGLVERIVCNTDRRVCYVHLSEKGSLIIEETLQQFDKQVMRILNEFGPEKSLQLIDLMNDLADILQTLKPDETQQKPKGGCPF